MQSPNAVLAKDENIGYLVSIAVHVCMYLCACMHVCMRVCIYMHACKLCRYVSDNLYGALEAVHMVNCRTNTSLLLLSKTV